MLLSPSVLVLVVFLESISGIPLPIPEVDDGKYRPMPGENGPLPGADGDNGMYRPWRGKNSPLPGPDGDNGIIEPGTKPEPNREVGVNNDTTTVDSNRSFGSTETVTEENPGSSSKEENDKRTATENVNTSNEGEESNKTVKEDNPESNSRKEDSETTETTSLHSSEEDDDYLESGTGEDSGSNSSEGDGKSTETEGRDRKIPEPQTGSSEPYEEENVTTDNETFDNKAGDDSGDGESNIATTSTNHDTHPSKSGDDTGNKVVCYFEDWAKSRPGKGSFGEDEMLNAPCTHVIYSFATLDASSNRMQYPFSPTAIQKLKDKGVKVMLAIGGAVDSNSDKYSRMAATPENRKVFIDSVLDVIKQHDFDGFDVDWEYPTCQGSPDTCGSLPQDKENFVQLIQELRRALPGKLLTIASHAGKNVVDKAYDLPSLHENLDWINVMTYDLHGSWEKEALNHSPLDAEEGLSINSAVQVYKSAGVPAKKIVIGVPTYGKSLKLADQTRHEYGAPVNGPGDAGPYSGEAGVLGYLEICENVKNSGWQVGGATEKVGPYAYSGDQFVGFDDVQTAERKAKYAQDQGLGGVMTWALGSDDFADVCGCGQYPIVSALHKVLVEGTAVRECRM